MTDLKRVPVKRQQILRSDIAEVEALRAAELEGAWLTRFMIRLAAAVQEAGK